MAIAVNTLFCYHNNYATFYHSFLSLFYHFVGSKQSVLTAWRQLCTKLQMISLGIHRTNIHSYAIEQKNGFFLVCFFFILYWLNYIFWYISDFFHQQLIYWRDLFVPDLFCLILCIYVCKTENYRFLMCPSYWPVSLSHSLESTN